MSAKMQSTKTDPAVSIIIPTYNRAGCLSVAINSVLEQTVQDLELIVVDDHSTDGTVHVLSEIRDERVKVFRHEYNRGANAARNTGLKKASGELIALQDSDDEWHPNKLERQFHRLRQSNKRIGAVYSGFWEKIGTRTRYRPPIPAGKQEGNLNKEILRRNFLGFNNLLARKRDVIRAGGFDEALPVHQDWEFHIRLTEICAYGFVEEPLLLKHTDENSSISKDTERFVKANRYILEKHRRKLERDPVALGYLLLRLGSAHCLNGDLRQGRKLLGKAVRETPINFKAIAAFLFSYTSSNLFKTGWDLLEQLRLIKQSVGKKNRFEFHFDKYHSV